MIWLVLLFLLMCAALVACWFEGAIRAEVYPAEAADAPTNPLLDPDSPRAKNFTGEEAAQLEATAQPAVPYVASDHPSDCGDACCWEIRLTEMHDSFDWEAREHEMRSKR